VFPCFLAGWLAFAGVLPWAGVAAIMLAWYGAEAALARAFGWPLRARSPLFWVARDLLLPVLWLRGSAVDVRATAPAPDAQSAMLLP
jgi:ceramide glucosyltransferase